MRLFHSLTYVGSCNASPPNKSDGCRIGQWDALVPLLPAVAEAAPPS